MFHPQGPTFRELAVQALSSTVRGYDLLAPKFEYTPFRTPDSILHASIAAIGGPRSVATALDICCGTGAAMRHLRPLCRERAVGLDFSQGMLAVARQLLAGASGDAAVDLASVDLASVDLASVDLASVDLASVDLASVDLASVDLASVDLVRADALNMPFSAAFDAAVCFGAFGHILPDDEPRFVAQVHRALRPGGRFVFATCHRPPAWSSAYVLSLAFNAAMRVRNLLVRPPFIMYYLTFLLPRAKVLLEECGFEVEVREGIFPQPFSRLVLVVATKRG